MYSIQLLGVASEDYTQTTLRRNTFTRLYLRESACSGTHVAVNVRQMKVRVCVVVFLVVFLADSVMGQRRTSGTTTAEATRTLTIATEPGAIVWLDEIRRGKTDENGKLLLANVRSGGHSVRIRASGFKENILPIQPTMRGEIKVRLLRTNDEAELTFQQAETARDTAKDDEARQKSAELYRRALRLRPAFPAANVGLARVLMDLNDTDAALDTLRLGAIGPAIRKRRRLKVASIVKPDKPMKLSARSIERFARATGFSPKRMSALVACTRIVDSTNSPRGNIKSRSINCRKLSRSFINCSAPRTRRVDATKKQCSPTKITYGSRQTARSRRRCAQFLSNCANSRN